MDNVTVYLHIGMPKTGTSALQYCLLKNRDQLYRMGIDYPPHPLDPNGISSGNAEQLVRALKNGNTSEAKQIVTEILNSSCSTIVLSSEYLYRAGEACLAAIKELFETANIKVILYLRRQDFLLVSSYNQGVKRAKRTSQMNLFIHEAALHRYTFEEVHTWASCWGKENINLRIYEKQQFVDGNIFSDFLDAIGISLTPEFELPPKRINTAYRIDAFEFMRQLNFLALPVDSALVDRVLQSYSESTGYDDDWPYLLISPEQQRNIVNSFTETNAAIAREYLGRKDETLFYDPLPDIDAPWKPFPGLTEQHVRRIASYMTKKDYTIAKYVGQAINEGLKSNDGEVRAAAETLSPGLDYFLPKYPFLAESIRYLKHRLRRIHQKISKKLNR